MLHPAIPSPPWNFLVVIAVLTALVVAAADLTASLQILTWSRDLWKCILLKSLGPRLAK